MLAETVTESLFKTLDRPDLQTLSERIIISLSPTTSHPFKVTPAQITLGRIVYDRPDIAPTLLRYAIEWSFLLQALPAEDHPIAALVSARVAALFHRLDSEMPVLPQALFWLSEMAAEVPPPDTRIISLWPDLVQFCPSLETIQPPKGMSARLAAFWSSIAPAETLMADGGDERLFVNSATGLNRYGCSHRPRPWAVTFSSSTASSLSERGFLGAELARRSYLIECIGGTLPKTARTNAVLSVREALSELYALPSHESVILAASGTDCELAVLAIALLQAQGRPVCNILIAPDETGSGVPLAAQGRHFAAGTALGAQTAKSGFLEGFPHETEIVGIAIRHPDGTPRNADEIDESCRAVVQQKYNTGYHVILHQLDMSKTGLVGPRPEMLETLNSLYADRLTIIVDACQARLSPKRIGQMLKDGRLVMITGSKFLTGPPFCGALMIPDYVATLLSRAGLPTGMGVYFHRSEWPETSAPGSLLRSDGNLGLALRWQAALAESRAFADIPHARIQQTLLRFEDHARKVITDHPDLTLMPVPPLDRSSLGDGTEWDSIPTIFTFLVRDPLAPDKPLGLDAARRLHCWLNADLTTVLRTETNQSPLAELLCHLGQPVPISHPALSGQEAGALRLCAGARLVSGEPSHAGLTDSVRLDSELRDVGRVMAKIGLILANWTAIAEADPVPRYAPFTHTHSPRKFSVS